MKKITKRVLSKIRQQLTIYRLMMIREPDITMSPIDGISASDCETTDEAFEIIVFGKKIDYNTINWHCDYNSGYCYPANKRFDKIKINKIFNQGIDVIFPWELSRFQFGIHLALCYHGSKNSKYYYLFKKLVCDWIENNPFMMGVNWISTMDVAIRAANWIVTANLFDTIFWEDKNFVSIISKNLYKHALYIEKFPRKIDRIGNNHLISGYSGLFLIALSFKHTNRGKRWFTIANKGLEYCIEKQIHEDGTNFESTIPYHRLTLELLSVPVILGRNYNIEFSKAYYCKLFKMFEFVSAYIDKRGNAPQIGDNDSGRFIKLSNCEEQNHHYLLELGKLIFAYHFEEDVIYQDLLPIFKHNVKKTTLLETGISPRKCKQSIFFTEGGYYFFKNKVFDLVVFCPTSNRGGHRHFDSGSFTLSYKGVPIVIDPGAGVYTSNLQIRRLLRDYPSHNIYYQDQPNLNNNDYFGIIDELDVKVISCSDNLLIIRTNFEDNLSVERQFTLSDSLLRIQDSIMGNPQDLYSAIHFAEKELNEIENNKLVINDLEIFISGAKDIVKNKYLYSPSYSIIEEREKIVIQPIDSLSIQIKILK